MTFQNAYPALLTSVRPRRMFTSHLSPVGNAHDQDKYAGRHQHHGCNKDER